MRALLAALLLASLALAGCSDAGKGADPPAAGEGAGAPEAGGPAGGSEASAPVLAPQWTVGQSWTWRLDSDALREPREATTYVIAADGAGYDVGVGDDFQGAVVHPFHLVGLGAIDAGCLCWTAHGQPVRFLRFPLRDGDTFTADFWGAPGAQVTLAAADVAAPDGPLPGFRSTVSYSGGGTFLAADYAPALGQFVRVASYFGGEEPFAEAVLTGTGTGGDGIAFRVTDLARFGANAGDASSLAPHPVTIPADADMALLACFLPAEPGVYGATLSTQDIPLACHNPSQDHTVLSWSHGGAQPGPGTVVATVAGQGNLNVEAFAIDTTLPGG